jgi:hypothetical protein
MEVALKRRKGMTYVPLDVLKRLASHSHCKHLSFSQELKLLQTAAVV